MAECIFCAIVEGRAPASRFFEDDRFVGIMDLHPWRPGHALLLPREHALRVGELPAGDAGDLFALGARVGEALRAGAVSCDDVHFVLNDGPVAFQSVPHVHLHVVPRTRGDGWRMLAALLRVPVAPLLGGAPRERLDAQAERIREHLLG